VHARVHLGCESKSQRVSRWTSARHRHPSHMRRRPSQREIVVQAGDRLASVGSRNLQQANAGNANVTAAAPDAGADPQIVVVTAPFDFQDAFDQGVRDIEIRAHMDITGLQGLPQSYHRWGEYFETLGLVKASTRSIRVRCFSSLANH
jgi:hypothetical protein